MKMERRAIRNKNEGCKGKKERKDKVGGSVREGNCARMIKMGEGDGI